MTAGIAKPITLSAIALLCTTHSAAASFIAPTRSQDSMVVSAHPLATDAGVDVLEAGGNAVDAAVATALVISVVEPFSAGIGGGGFLLHLDAESGEIRALDFRERAPQAASRDMYLDDSGDVLPRASLDGHLAVGVPGTVAGLAELHQAHGDLAWTEVVTPALEIAQNGFPVSDRFVGAVERRWDVLSQNPAAMEAFTNEGRPLSKGDFLVQPDMAVTLQAIAADPQAFYDGDIAEAIAADMAANNGLVTLEDLNNYEPIWRDPVCGPFREVTVCSMPPPSSGGVHLLQLLNLLGDRDLAAAGWHDTDSLHLAIESMRIAYADRATHLGDPDFYEVPEQELIDPDYADLRRAEIDMENARDSDDVMAADEATLAAIRESEDTSHLTVVDSDRNAISLTFTVNGGFGAAVVADGTGILLNNEMDDFAAAPGVPNLFGLVGGEANAIAPGKTPLSSMTPTIVIESDRDGTQQLRLATGSPGGSTIITTVLQIVLNVVEYGMDAGEAVSAPRLHHQWLPDVVRVEEWGFDAATVRELEARGHELEVTEGWGNAGAIVVTPDGWLEGAADPRGEGVAGGF
ncbi:MAG: gamma-glutamyltransferase [Cyanobacteria bacterium P01_A01_bin.3]